MFHVLNVTIYFHHVFDGLTLTSINIIEFHSMSLSSLFRSQHIILSCSHSVVIMSSVVLYYYQQGINIFYRQWIDEVGDVAFTM